MNIETNKIIHNFKKELDELRTALECVVFDLKHSDKPDENDLKDLAESVSKMDSFIKELKKV